MAKRQARYQPWEIRDFSAGQVEKLNDNILPDNAAHECRNFISSRFGGLSKRNGQEKLNTAPLPATIQGLHPYYFPSSDTRYLIAMSQGLGFLWNGSEFTALSFDGASSAIGEASFPLIGTSLWAETMFDHPMSIFPLNPSEPTLFADSVNYLIGMNGVNAPWKWDGSIITTLTNAPTKGRYPVLHKEKLFCVDTDDPSTLVWSESFDPEDWPAINYWDVTKGDGDEVTALIKFVDDLLVFKNRSLHALKGTSLDDFSMQEISSYVGCVGPRAVTVHDLKVYFVSEYGLYVSNGMNVLNISEMVIPDTWESVNKEYLHRAAVTTWDDMIWISVPTGVSTVNNLVLLYDPKKQSFWPMDTIGASCYSYYNDGTGDGVRLYAGSPSAGYVNIQDEGTEDNSVAIDAYWRGKFFDMGTPEIEKKSRKVFVQDSPDTAEVADVSVCLDYESSGGSYVYNNLTFARTDGLTREYLFDIDENRWRYISPMITHDSTGACEIRGVVIPYKPKRDLGVRTLE